MTTVGNAIIDKYLGRPYALGANGPDAFDCRGLLIAVQRDEFGKAFPDLPNGDEMRRLYEARLQSGLWELVDAPNHGDGVILRGGDQPHVGVYLIASHLECGVLHAVEDVGVMWTNVHSLRRQGFSRVQYIRFREGASYV